MWLSFRRVWFDPSPRRARASHPPDDERQPFDVEHLDLVSEFEWLTGFVVSLPQLAVHGDEPLAPHLAVRSDQRVRADLDRPPPDLDDLRERECEEERKRPRDAQGDGQRDLVGRACWLEQEQRAEDEAGCARERERAVAERKEQLGDPERERRTDQHQACPVDRQDVEPEEGDRQSEDPERGREDEPWMPELDDDSEYAERQHQRDQVRVDQRVEDALPDRHVHRGDLGAGRVQDEPLRHGLVAVDLGQERRQCRRDEIDHVLAERLVRREIRRLTHRVRGPGCVPAVGFRKHL